MSGARARTVQARLAAGLFACALALLSGCAQLVPQTIALRSQWPSGVPQSTELGEVPFFPQEELQCGPAALATVLGHTGAAATPEQLAGQVFLPQRGGSLQLEMLAAPRRWGRVAYRLAPNYPDLLREVAAGNPVVVLQDVGPLFTQWHYAVVNGFDYPSGTVYLRSGRLARQAMPFTAFERSWMKSGYWAMVVTPPDRIPASATEQRWVEAVLALARVDGAAAARAYQAALARWPANVPAAVGLANWHHGRGAYPQAAAVLRAALQHQPDSVILKNNLAQTLSDQGRHREALAVIDGIAEDSPFGGEVKSTRSATEQRLQESRAGAASR